MAKKTEKVEKDMCELTTSTTTPFAFTLRKVTKAENSTKSDYALKLQKFKDMGVQITDLSYEKNKTNSGLHCHGTMQIPKKFNMKKFRTRGWHIKLDEIYDYWGWCQYMTKEGSLETPSLNPIVDPDTAGAKSDSDTDERIEDEFKLKVPKCKLF